MSREFVTVKSFASEEDPAPLEEELDEEEEAPTELPDVDDEELDEDPEEEL